MPAELLDEIADEPAQARMVAVMIGGMGEPAEVNSQSLLPSQSVASHGAPIGFPLSFTVEV
jgi:hypothetical protein